jgi:hypothetical protein
MCDDRGVNFSNVPIASRIQSNTEGDLDAMIKDMAKKTEERSLLVGEPLF